MIGFRDCVDCLITRNRGFSDLLPLRGEYPLIELIRDGQVIHSERVKNGITIAGKNYILNAGFNEGTQEAVWAIGLISSSGYSALNESDTMGSHASWTEFTTYSEGTRPLWGQGTASSKQITNAAAAVFTISAVGTLKGIFVVSENTKGGTTGVLWAHGLFNADVPVAMFDQIRITYTVAT